MVFTHFIKNGRVYMYVEKLCLNLKFKTNWSLHYSIWSQTAIVIINMMTNFQ